MVVAVALTVLALGIVAAVARGDLDASAGPDPASAATPTPPVGPSASKPVASPEPSPSPVDHSRVGPWTVGAPWGSVVGLTMFRGNPTRNFYGLGPVPSDPQVAWRYPDRPMCTTEVVGYRTVTPGEEAGEVDGAAAQDDPPPSDPPPSDPPPSEEPAPAPSPDPEPTRVPVTKLWCGTGWTGQPVIWERPDGVTEAIVGAYDGAVHFLDVATGRPTRPVFQTGDMIKGSVTLDPDGYPILYFGSRDNHLRAVALDRPEPTELWSLPPNANRVWNNDWDGNPVIVDGILFEGGEDSWFYAIELNRRYGSDGLVAIDPKLLVQVPGWTEDQFRQVGDRNVSIENSVAVFGDRVYFANSGGRVVGLDVSGVRDGEAPVVLDYWVGDDVDATIVVDDEGMLYVSVELERFNARSEELGQLVKLDPSRPDDPFVWGVAVPPLLSGDDGGIWATPALHGGVLYVTTHPGELLAVDRATGEVVYREDIGYHEWSSPVVVDDTLVVGLCEQAGLRAYDVTDPTTPRPLWHSRGLVGGCVESTPAVWKGRIVVGSRDGYLYGFR